MLWRECFGSKLDERNSYAFHSHNTSGLARIGKRSGACQRRQHRARAGHTNYRDTANHVVQRPNLGSVGAYEQLRGSSKGEIDPNDRRNALITDIQLAPRNVRGNVEYTASFTIIKPLDMSRASGVMTYEVVNRGNHLLGGPGAFLNVGGFPGTSGDPGDGFFYKQGDVLVWSGWQGDILPESLAPGSSQEEHCCASGQKSRWIVGCEPGVQRLH